MSYRLSAIAAAGLLVLPALAWAQGFAPTGQDLLDREAGQRDRIETGIRSGQLTRDEARELTRRAARIHGMIEAARYDGYVDPRERERIERSLRDQDRRIFRERRDDDRRRRASRSSSDSGSESSGD